ncbi:hypothetical protein A9179_01700 [Pseudomonas alcaligenes]|uniref:Uncharacterized protein n=1 Tax=Aquipseudomonas alcaligenes TaxID=43263 RepID=A0ABR7RUX3_AQUAC|nr:hypothetical protein [Pseudomonas alcaligenes]MBC9248980.1 hypothetical protein [Pseudomonas alcaligenes]
MSLVRLHAWDFSVGVMSGSTLAYLLAVLLGLLLPSWPFNAFFTPLALVSLALQGPSWRVADADRGACLRGGLQLGMALVLALWLAYLLWF